MLEFVFVFGAAAVSLSVMNGLLQKQVPNLTALIQNLLVFGLLDLGAAALILAPLGRMNILHGAGGSLLDIGGTALLCMVPIALIVGVIAAYVRLGMSFRAKIEYRGENSENNKNTENEQKAG